MGTTYTGVPANVSLASAASITVPADGDPDNAATFDVGMQKLTDYVEAVRTGSPLAVYNSGAGQVIAAGATTIINYGTVETDSDAAVTVGAAWHFTVPAGKGGDYFIAASIGLNSAQAGLVGLQIYKNSVASKLLSQYTSQVVSQAVNGAVTLRLAVADTIDIRVFNGGAGTLTLAPSGSSVWVSIKRVT